MARLVWGAPGERFYEQGLDRGVLYPQKAPDPAQLIATNLCIQPSFEVSRSEWSNATGGTTGVVEVSRIENSTPDYGNYSLQISTAGLGGDVNSYAMVSQTLTSVKPSTE